MDIIENELILKYFGTEHKGCPPDCGGDHDGMIAFRVLRAMQEPIQKGERYLCLAETINERISGSEKAWMECLETLEADLHPTYLRLPDRFQPKATGCEFPACPRQYESGLWCRLCVRAFVNATRSWRTLDALMS